MTLKLSLSTRFRRTVLSRVLVQGTKFATLTSALGLAVLSPLQCFAQVASSSKQSSAGAKPGEVPALVEASDEGVTAIGSFQFPESMRCNLFAAEPMFANPVAFSFDRFGRVFVCESYRQNKGVTDNRGHDDKWLDADLAAMNVQDRIRYHRELLGKEAAEYERFDDLIRVLIDRDGDNKADDSKVFVSGFNGIEEGTGAGVLVRDEMVYYTNIPKLWGFKDTNNDLVADERIVLSDGYGVRVAFRGHDMHGLIIGPDGRLYFSIGDRGYSIETPNGKFQDPESGAVFRCELDGSNLEIFATGLRNPQELAFDDEGNLFTGDNNSDSGDKARWVQVVQGGDTGWRMMYQYISDRGPFNREKIWYPYEGVESPAYVVPPIANISDGPSGLICYTGVGLENSEQYKNAFFLCDFRGQSSNSGIRRIQLKPKGATFEVDKNEQFIWRILATDIDTAPDGSLVVSDWVNGWNGENKGRLYRFESKSDGVQSAGKQSAEALKQGFRNRTDKDLVALLASPDRRLRLEAQWELAKRKNVKAFVDVLQNAKSRSEKLHAVWGLGQIVRTQNETTAGAALIQSLSDSDEYVVARACDALAESRIEFSEESLKQLVLHPSPIVRRQAMLAVATKKTSSAMENVARAIIENADQDPVLRHAAIMAVSKAIDANEIERWAKHPSDSVRVVLAVGLRKAKNPAIKLLLSDPSVRVVKEAVRAIYDVPELHSELPSLASLTIAREFDEPIVDRILNANYRLGKEENIDRLVAFVLSNVGTDKMREVAMNLLGDWKSPGLRDKVMNRHLPLPDRSVEPVVERLQRNVASLAATPDVVRDAFFKVGAKYDMKEIASLIGSIVSDSKAPVRRRADAIVALASLNPEALKKQKDALLSDPQAMIRVAALQSLVKMDRSSAASAVEKAISSKAAGERQAAWDLIASLEDSEAQTLLGKYSEKLFSGELPKDTWLNAAEAVAAKGTAAMKQALETREKKFEAQAASDPKALYSDCVEGGDVETGRELFFTRSNLSCVRCHKVGETGGEVGPNLSQLGKQKDSSYLLEAIVAPNQAIAQGFETVVLLTEDDETLSGILKSETDSKLSIMDAQGAVIEVEKDAIVSRKKGLSSMPADLMKYLTKRELRDLVAYLSSLDGSPESLKSFGATGGHALE